MCSRIRSGELYGTESFNVLTFLYFLTIAEKGVALITSTAAAYKYSVAGHLSFGAPKCEKAQKLSGFWANRTYWLCIKDNVLIDPACGSGNFLTETYLSLRRLENEALKAIIECETGMEGQTTMSEANPIKVSINQFYGIEINDFAVAVANTALRIAESQMIKETEEITQKELPFLPLSSYDNIVECNALRIDWESVVPKDKLTYIISIILTNKQMSTLGSPHIILIHFCLIISSSDFLCCQGRRSVHFSLDSIENQS